MDLDFHLNECPFSILNNLATAAMHWALFVDRPSLKTDRSVVILDPGDARGGFIQDRCGTTFTRAVTFSNDD